MDEIKFKVGQKWRTRYGDTVLIVEIDPHSTEYPVAGIHESRDESPITQHYTLDGCWLGYGEPDDRDLVELIEDVASEPTPDADGWIKWEGGECPVPGDAQVEVEFDGSTYKVSAGALEWKWLAGGAGGDITRYRVVRLSEPANPQDDDPYGFDAASDALHLSKGGAEVLAEQAQFRLTTQDELLLFDTLAIEAARNGELRSNPVATLDRIRQVIEARRAL